MNWLLSLYRSYRNRHDSAARVTGVRFNPGMDQPYDFDKPKAARQAAEARALAHQKIEARSVTSKPSKRVLPFSAKAAK